MTFKEWYEEWCRANYPDGITQWQREEGIAPLTISTHMMLGTSKMEQLFRLPNGAWIYLTQVSSIVPQDTDEVSPDLPPRVNVVLGAKSSAWDYAPHFTLSFDSFASAQAYADELAGLVNAALAEKDT